VKPKIVHKKDRNSFCLVVCTAIDNKDKVGKDLQDMEIRNGKYFHYILFKYSSSEIKLGSLYINDVSNMEVRYEFIEDTTIDDLVEFKGKQETIRDALLSVKYNNHPLFTIVEQEVEKFKYRVYMLMIPRLRSVA